MDTIEHYQLERPLGAGAFATVWLAHDPVLDGPVAIKVLAENWSLDDDVRSRFMDEARLMHRASDPQMVRVLRAGELASGQPYFVMEYADRGTLAERLDASTATRSPEESVELIAAIAECAGSVHAHGFVHRDIKPANVLITSTPSLRAEPVSPLASDERLLLADFGLAKDVAAASGFTRAAGSPAYMAPEQTKTSHLIDHRTDIYALGVMAVEVLTGRSPNDDDFDLSGPNPVSVHRSDLAPFDAVIRTATAPRPENRHASVDAFVDDLRRAAGTSHLTSTPPLDPELPPASSPMAARHESPIRRILLLAAGAAAVVAIVAGLIIASRPDGSSVDVGDQTSTEASTSSEASVSTSSPTMTVDSSTDASPATTDSDGRPEPVPFDTTGFEDLCGLTDPPAGAIVGQAGPAFCSVVDGQFDFSTNRVGDNYWIDDFDHGVDQPTYFGTRQYEDFDLLDEPAQFWIDDDHVLIDMGSTGAPGFAMLVPRQPFDFGDGLVVEMDVAAGPTAVARDRYALPEVVVLDTDPGFDMRQGATASRTFVTSAVSCGLHPVDVVACEAVDASAVDVAAVDDPTQGRLWRTSVLGVEGVDATVADRGSASTEVMCADGLSVDECTRRYRVELTSSSVRVEIDGELLYEQAGVELPETVTDGSVTVLIALHNSGIDAGAVRATFDRLAINPDLAENT